MPRHLSTGLIAGTLMLTGLVACNSGGDDPILGEPINTDIQQVRIGNSIVDFNGLNLLHMNGSGRIRVDVNQPVILDRVRETIALNIVIEGEDGSRSQITGFDAEQLGSYNLIDRDLGIIDWVPIDGALDGLQPGVRYRINISSFYMQVGNKKPDGVGLTDEEFDLIPLSLPFLPFDTALESDGLINRITLGTVGVDRRDSTFTLVPMDATTSVQVDLATSIDPATFQNGLQYELVINNLTRGQSFNFSKSDLDANGDFTFPNANNSTIIWTKSSPGGLSQFTSTASGGTVDVSDVGDELELRFDRVSGLRSDGARLTLRDRAFRILHTFGTETDG